MKTRCNSLIIKNFLLFFMLALWFTSCEKEEPAVQIDYLKLYNEPKYPKKAGGRFLKNITYQYPDSSSTSNFPIEDGIKVEFFYNAKNYVDYFKIYGSGNDSVGRVVKIEYNLTGLVSRIKYFNPDSVIIAFELFEYSAQKQLTRISKYELAEDQIAYALASYNKFSYPSPDKIEELRYLKSLNFDRPFKDIYFYDTAGNIKEKIDYEYDTPNPYSSIEFYYNNKKRPFENLGLPAYEISYDSFQKSEIFSKNHMIGWQTYSYESSVKVAVGDSLRFKMEYDSLDYPVSREGSIFYNYIDLE